MALSCPPCEHNSGPFGPVILTLSPGRYTEAVPSYQIRVEGRTMYAARYSRNSRLFTAL